MTKNTILVNNIINIDNQSILLENQIIKNINAVGKCELNLLNCNIMKLKIKVKENSCLILNWFNIINTQNTTVDIKCEAKSSLIFNHSYLNQEKYHLKIESKFLSQESSISINVNGINDQGISEVIVEGYVNKDRINNVLNENISFINLAGGKVISHPNMYVNTSLVMANHNVAIKNIDQNELLYLMSKGINEIKAEKLICNGFLIKLIPNRNLKTKIKEIINRR